MVLFSFRCLEDVAQAQVMWTITEKDDMIPEGMKRGNFFVFPPPLHHTVESLDFVVVEFSWN